MRILAISGKRGAGKDTMADWLVLNGREFFGVDVCKQSLALPIKRDIARHYGGDMAIMCGTNAEKDALCPHSGMSYRELLRRIGKVYTDIDPTHFARLLYSRCISNRYEFVVVNDMRFLCEAEYLCARGAKLVRLTRAENPDDSHITECDLDTYNGFDLVVNNRNMTVHHARMVLHGALSSWGWLKGRGGYNGH